MTNIQQIEFILSRMINLLNTESRADWPCALERIRRDINGNPRTEVQNILAMFGGLGSLNDIILYKDGQLLTDENSEFDSLRSSLHDACMKFKANPD